MPILDKSKRNLLNVFELFRGVAGVSLIQAFKVFHNGVSKIEHLIFQRYLQQSSITPNFTVMRRIKTG